MWPIVVKHSMKNTPDDNTAHLQLMAWAKQHGTDVMQKFIFKSRARLPSLINDIWQWEHVEQDLPFARMSRMDALQVAAGAGCSCEGKWTAIVKESLETNNLDAQSLFSDIFAALQQGRSATTPVIVMAGSRGGEGKAILLKALMDVYGAAHVS